MNIIRDSTTEEYLFSFWTREARKTGFTYTPNTHFVGTESFTYTVSDGTHTSTPATVTIDVTDDVPTANPQSWDTPEGTALTVNAASGLLASSSDDDGDSLTAQVVSNPSNGSLTWSSNGSFTYTPNAGFFGSDSFTYEASDGVSTSAAATVTISVNEVLSQSNNDFRSVATGDFNGDGNADFVAANYSTNAVSVFLGNGDGTFQTPSVFNVGNGPLAVAVGNFGNGAEDIAVANSLDGTVTILMNNGSGGFTTSQTIGVGSDPVSIAVGDFLGDGVEDLAVANEGANTVSLLQNNGSGVFSVVATLAVGNAPDAVAAGDLNGDGKDDLVVANSGDNTISVLLSNGNGTFAAPVNYAVGSGPTAVALADLDQDGNLDVAVANGGSNNVSVLLGNGDGTLGAPVNYAVGSDPVGIAVGDFNGDGLPDLGVVNHGSNDDTELFNNASGGAFLDSQTNPLGESPDDVAVADFNKDGAADQIVDQKAEEVKGQDTATLTYKVASISSKDDQVLAIASDNTVHVWNFVPPKGYAALLEGSKIYKSTGTHGPLTAAVFSPTNANLVAITQSSQHIDDRWDFVITLWDSSTDKEIQQISPMKNRLPQSVNSSLAYSPDGKKLAVGASTGQVWVYTVGRDNKLTLSQTIAKTIHEGAMSIGWLGPNTLVTSDTKGGVEVWDTSNAKAGSVTTPTLIKKITAASLEIAITAVGVGGGRIAIVTANGTNLYKLDDGKVKLDKTAAIGKGYSFVALSSDGKYIALGFKGVLDEYPLDNLSKSQSQIYKSLSSIGYSPDGTYLIFSADDGKSRAVRVYKANNFQKPDAPPNPPLHSYH